MCLCPRIFSDVYNSSMWEELHASIPEGDETLSTIAESPPDVVLAGRTASTSTKHWSSYGRWKSWASLHRLQVFPDSPLHVALYLRFLMSSAKTASPLESAQCSQSRLGSSTCRRTVAH